MKVHECFRQPKDFMEYEGYNPNKCLWCGVTPEVEEKLDIIYDLKEALVDIVELDMDKFLTKDCFIYECVKIAKKALEKVK